MHSRRQRRARRLRRTYTARALRRPASAPITPQAAEGLPVDRALLCWAHWWAHFEFTRMNIAPTILA